MKLFKKLIIFILLINIIFNATGCWILDFSDSQRPIQTDQIRFVTGSESGSYYALGSVIAQHAFNNAGINIIGISGNGSRSNVFELEDRNAELAFCQTDVLTYAYNGTNLFENPIKCFSVVGALYAEQVQIVTINPNIKTPSDLKGKKVSIGAAGSGVYFNASDILKCYNLSEKDIIPTYQSFGDSAESLKDGKIDAAFIVSGTPTTAVTDLGTTKKINILSIDDEHINKLINSSPYYTKCVIPKNTYKLDNDVTTVAVGAVLIARNDVSKDSVYKLCRDIFDNPSSLVSSHAKYKEINLEYGSSIKTVPYHPGAVKYFKEKGIEVK